ncbi:MAG: YlmC/YmxH family sporulation protein [Candidatus Coprovivens sp.]
MFLSELQSKDIISTKDGRRLGRIIDAEINNQGQIITLVLEEKKSFKKIMMSTNDSKVPFTSITKIGEDVILVDI